MKRTFSIKSSEVSRDWILVDASEAPLGRLATVIAKHLIGKHKPTYTPHVDGGDYVVVINAKNLVITGDKMNAKKYYRYSGYPGGLKQLSLREKLDKDPSEVVRLAVKGMLPKNKLAADRLARLRIFVGEEHEHTAQKPQKVEVHNG